MAHLYSGLYDFQMAMLKALDLEGRLVGDIKIHIPTEGLVTIKVEMVLTQENAKEFLNIDWENAPTRTVIVLEKPEDESVNSSEKSN